MTYVRFNVNHELKNVAQGKKTKADVRLVLFLALKDYPAIQRRICKAFSITED